MLLYRDNAYEEAKVYFDMGLDGLFTEFPHTTLDTFEDLVLKKHEKSEL